MERLASGMHGPAHRKLRFSGTSNASLEIMRNMVFLVVAGFAALCFLAGADDVPNTPVGVAQWKLTNARAAAQDAARFHSVADKERMAARGGDARARYDEEKWVAADRLRAADAKVKYADALVTLRRQEVELRHAELALTLAEANLSEYDRLHH